MPDFLYGSQFELELLQMVIGRNLCLRLLNVELLKLG
jgi:hypothetical protein